MGHPRSPTLGGVYDVVSLSFRRDQPQNVFVPR